MVTVSLKFLPELQTIPSAALQISFLFQWYQVQLGITLYIIIVHLGYLGVTWILHQCTPVQCNKRLSSSSKKGKRGRVSVREREIEREWKEGRRERRKEATKEFLLFKPCQDNNRQKQFNDNPNFKQNRMGGIKFSLFEYTMALRSADLKKPILKVNTLVVCNLRKYKKHLIKIQKSIISIFQ